MANRRGFVAALAILVASILSFYFDKAEFMWAPITAFIVTQLPEGFQLRQTFVIIFVMVVAIITTGLWAWLGIPPWLYAGLLGVMIVLCSYLYVINPNAQRLQKLFVLLVPFAFVLASLMYEYSIDLIKDRCIAVAMGGLIGFVATVTFLKFDAAKTFKKDMVPIIDCMINYVEEFANQLAESTAFPIKTATMKLQMMDKECRGYPEWIYTPGFNPGLRSGMRFFLIHMERISEILFSLEFLLKQPVAMERWQEIGPYFIHALQGNKNLLLTLSRGLQNKNENDIKENFTQDIADLEAGLQRAVPSSLELVDLDPSNLILIAMGREIKDMRNILLQLVLILQKATQEATIH